MWQQQQRLPLPPQQQQGQQHQQRQMPGDYFYPSNANYNPSHGNSSNPMYGNQYTNNDAADPYSYQSLLLELDDSIIRKMVVTHQVQNLSSLGSSLTGKAEYLSGRIGALSERLADSESNYHVLMVLMAGG